MPSLVQPRTVPRALARLLWRERAARRLALALTASLCVGAVACTGAPAATHASHRFVAADGSFSFRYVAPPWEVTQRDESSVELQIAAEAFGVAFDESPPTHLLVVGPVDASSGFDGLLDSVGVEAAEFDTDGFDTDGFDTDGFDTDGFDPGQLPDLPDEATGEVPDIPDYLLDVDLDNPRDVAFAELQYLLDEQGARIDRGVSLFRTEAGLEGVAFQVVMDPGVFVRSFYFPTLGRTLRVGFVSLFDLETADVQLMMETFRTDLSRGGALEANQ